MNSRESKKEYISRINKVIDYIEENLDKNLSLEELSRVALFSKYHFHRIFKAIIGESVNEYTKRLRLEKALILLKNFKDYSITDVGLEVGFSSTSNFSLAFKDYYGITPSSFKRDKNISLIHKLISRSKVRVCNSNIEGNQEIKMRIEKLPDYNIIYVRHIGSYFDASEAWQVLMDFAQQKNIIDDETLMIGISYDDPQITDEKKLRYDACLTVDNIIIEDKKIGTNIITGGLFAVWEFYDKPTELINMYDYIYSRWFPESGYMPDDKNCFEIYKNDINKNKEGKALIDIYVPLRKIK